MKRFPLVLLTTSALALSSASCLAEGNNEGSEYQEKEIIAMTPAEDRWHFKLGYLQETENTEGQSFDKDGTFMPTYYLFSWTKDWSVWLALHQEYYNFSYRDGSHGTRLNRHEFTLRHQYYTSPDLQLGFSLGFTEYLFAINNERGDNTSTTAQRYAVQPDWDWSITDKLSYAGWIAYYEKQHNLQKIQYSRHQIETENGINYKLSDDATLKINFYFNRGWDNADEKFGEFSDPQIRGYLPIRWQITENSSGTLMPYFRASLGLWYYNAGKGNYEHSYFNRFGLRWEQNFWQDWNWFVDYAYEPRKLRDASPGQQTYTNFHYTSAGLSYTF